MSLGGRGRARAALYLLLSLALMALIGGCDLVGTPEAGPTPAPATETPAATPTVAAPTATPEQALWEPIPTLASVPSLTEVIELAGPPAPGLGPAAIALVGERLYVANEESANLSLIENGAVRQVLPLTQGPYHLAPDGQGGRLYVLQQFDRSVVVVEGEQAVARWELPFAPTAGALVGDALWVGGMAGELARLEASTGAALEPAPAPMAGMVEDVVVTESGVLVGSHQEVALYDGESLQRRASQPVAGYRALAVAGTSLYLCTDDLATGESWLERWDLATLAPQARLEAPDDTGALWADGAAGRAVLAGATSHRLYLLDLGSGATLAETAAGLAPRQMAYDADRGLVHITHGESHTIVSVSPEDLSVVGRVPVALRVTALAAGPEPGSLAVGLNTGEVRLLRRGGTSEAWPVGVYPSEIAYVPLLDRVAVLERAVGELLLVDRQGNVTHRYPTGPDPQGLYVDTPHQSIYAGDLRLFWSTGAQATMRIPAGLGVTYPPVGVLRDTRRDRLYAIAWNGVAGSNGGYQMVREVDGVWNEKLPAPGRVSVIDAAYDERTDRFYSTHAHMGQFGLQVAEGETAAEVAYIALDRYPQAMALNGELWHLWLALPSGPDEPAHTRLWALDTRTLTLASTLQIPDRIGRMALDPATQRLYLAAEDEGRIYVVQDVALPAPPMATATMPVATPEATATTPATVAPTRAAPEPTATMAPTATLAPSVTAAPTPTEPCAYEVHPELQAAWELADAGGLGCPHGPALTGQWGWQPFEHGEMFWFDATRQILILFGDGTWTFVDDHWQEGMPDLSCEASPPPGLWQPIRGFGLAWCQAPGVRERLGWALQSEEAFVSVYQAFAGGSLITHPEGGGFWLDRSGSHYRITPPPIP